MLAVDDETNLEAGVVYNKPVGRFDNKFSIRGNRSENLEGDAQSVFQSQGLAFVAQTSIGRWTVDGQWMREQVTLADRFTKLNLDTSSFGVHAKFDLVSLSVTAVQRDNELSDTERSLSLGLRVDIARGFALNLGANIFNTKLIDDNFSSYSASLRYQF